MKFASSLLLSLLVGCTIAPKVNTPGQPSWDGPVQNSGLIAQLPDHSFIVTPLLVDKFEALCHIYGSRFVPPATNSFGCTATTTNTFIMTPYAMSVYAQMSVLFSANLTTKP